MPRPPETPPHSDLDGIAEDEVRNTDAAIAAGQDTSDLARARDEAAGKPDFSADERGRDERSR
jgi:hypothetical protein